MDINRVQRRSIAVLYLLIVILMFIVLTESQKCPSGRQDEDVCDGILNCVKYGDKQNDKTCQKRSWTCSKGSCVKDEYLCNGIFDCMDYNVGSNCTDCVIRRWQCDKGQCTPTLNKCFGKGCTGTIKENNDESTLGTIHKVIIISASCFVLVIIIAVAIYAGRKRMEAIRSRRLQVTVQRDSAPSSTLRESGVNKNVPITPRTIEDHYSRMQPFTDENQYETVNM